MKIMILLFLLVMVGCTAGPNEAAIRGPRYAVPDIDAFMEYQIYKNPQYVYWVEI